MAKVKKDKLQSRIDNLFADLGDDTFTIPADQETIPGWTWECDSRKRYINCSAEVEKVLGIGVEEILDQSLDIYRLSPESADAFNALIEADIYPSEIRLQFLSKDDNLIPTRTHVVRTKIDGDGYEGWRGFTQVLKQSIPIVDQQKSYSIMREPQIIADIPSPPPVTLPSTPYGVAIEEDQLESVSVPYTSTGQKSLKNLQTITQKASADSPGAIAVPVALQNQALGLLEIIDQTPGRSWSEDEQRLVEEVADQLSLALENARLYQDAQNRAEEMVTLHEITVELAQQQLDLDYVLSIITERTMTLLDADGCEVWFWHEGDQELELVVEKKPNQTGAPKQRVKPGEGLIGEAFNSNTIQVIDDYKYWLDRSATTDDGHFHAAMVIPMKWQNQAIGLLSLTRSQEGYPFTSGQQNLAQLLTSQGASVIHGARLFEQIQNRSVQLQTAAEVSRAASSILDPIPLIQQTVELIRERFNLYYAGLFMVDDIGQWTNEPGRWAVLRAGTGESGRIQIERSHKLEIGGQSMIGQCISNVQAKISQQAGKEVDRYVNPLLPDTQSEMALPLISRGKVIGGMTIQSSQANAFSEEDISILQTMADQIANALQNAYLIDETQARAHELGILNEMSRALSGSLDITAVVRNIYLFTSRLLDTSTFFVSLYEAENNLITFPLCIEDNKEITFPSRKLEAGLTEYVIKNQQPLLIRENVEGWLHEHGVDLKLTGEITQSWLGAPLIIGDQAIGVIAVENVLAGHYNEQHKDLLVAISSQSSIALQNSQLFSQIQTTLTETETLYNVTRIASGSLELETTLDQALIHVLNSSNLEVGLISIHNTATNQLEMVSHHNLPTSLYEKLTSEGLEGSLCDYVYQVKEPVVINEFSEDGPIDVSGLVKMGLNSYLGVPLEARGEVLGTLCAFSYSPRVTQSADLSLLQAVGQQVGVAVENANLFGETLTQTENLSILNEMGRALTNLLDINIIAETVFKYTSQLMDTTNFFISLFDSNTEYASFPLVINDNDKIEVTPRKLGGGLTDHVLQTGEPLLLSDDVTTQMEDLGIQVLTLGDTKVAQSWLGVPMAIGDQIIGAIVVQSTSRQGVYDQRHRDLLFSIAGQTAITIQNANLFDQVQNALDETEKLARRLSVLNELGEELNRVDTLEESYTIIIDKTQAIFAADRVVIATITPDGNSFEAQGIQGPEGNEEISKIIPFNGSAIETTIIQNQIQVENDVEEDVFGPIRSYLVAPIVIGGVPIGCLSIGSNRPQSYTSRDENFIFQVSSVVGSHFENRKLFTQVQEALSESEILYQASAKLNAVQTTDDILLVLRDHTILGMNVRNISINMFDRPWIGEDVPDYFAPIARWNKYTAPPIRIPQYNLNAWTTVDQLLNRDRPTLIGDPVNDSRLDETTRGIYIDHFHAMSVIFAPMIIGGQWIGHVNANYEEPIEFPEAEIRKMMTLIGQAAVAVQNLRLRDDSLRKARQLETAAEIARDTSGTLSLDELLNRSVNLIRERFGFYHASIFLLDESRMNSVVRASTGEAGAELVRTKHQLEVGSQSIIGTVTESGTPLVVNDVYQNPTHRPHHLLPDTQAELGIPLKIGQRVIGALDVQSEHINSFSSDDIAVIQTLADQISVAIDNARTYELAQDAITETRRRVQDLTTISEISQSLARAPLASIEVASLIARQFIDVFPGQSSCTVSIHSPEDDLMRVMADIRIVDNVAVRGDEANYYISDFPATNQVMESGVPMAVALGDEQEIHAEFENIKSRSVTAFVLLPLAVKSQSIGVIKLESQELDFSYDEIQVNLLLTMANQAAVALENARLYEEQREITEQLRELDQLKSQFLANMSHELRTPLNSIIGFSRVIMKGIDGPVTDLQQQDLSAIYNAGQHLLNMINDILDISKIEAGKMDLAYEDIHLPELIQSMMSTARGLVKDKSIDLIMAVPEDLPAVHADPTRIRQIMLNLLSNAAKFTDEGSITVEAYTQTNSSGYPEVIVRVKDTGLGIANQDRDKLFQPFSQVDGSATRKTGGTGLGLSISRLLVEMHDGQIDFESEPGHGSNFYFTLPLPSSISSGPREERTILAIDNDLGVIKLYEYYLNDKGYKIIPLTNPIEAIDSVRRHKPYAITLDVLHPEYDGWQLLKDLKADPETMEIPVLICSMANNRDHGLDLGAADHLVKPILEEDLVFALERLAKR